MQIPHPRLNIRARDFLKLIHKNQVINLSSSRHNLKDQLDFYLEHFSTHVGKNVSQKDAEKILKIITRNNQVSRIVNSRQYKALLLGKKKLLGDAALSLVFCIDGRIPAIFIGGKFTSHWEVPAAELTVKKRKSDGKIIPESNELCEAFRKAASSGKDILEIVFSHTSMLDPHHGCGAMAAKREMGILDKNLSNEEANLQIIESTTIPSMTTIYNEFRQQYGFEALKQVAVPALYDTDSFGVIFNFARKGLELSTTDLTNKFRNLMDDYFIKNNIIYGSFREKFTNLKYLTKFSQNELTITEALLTAKEFAQLSETLDQYILKNYPDLTDNQKTALKFFICRTIALQYLTGACKVTKSNRFHPFAKHEEEYMAVSTRGATIGKYDPEEQGFCSTPADSQTAIVNIKTKLSIMDTHKKNHTKPSLLFICNPVNKRDLKENSNQLHKVLDANAELFRAVLEDKDLGKLVEKLELIPLSILVDEDTSQILNIIDHSVYI